MCGIAGVFSPGKGESFLQEVTLTMTKELQHRGPDDSGSWCDESSGIALGHQRLSIIDLSSAGRQPMSSASGRYVICYNGELYNFRELKDELAGDGVRFVSETDTEVLLNGIEKWGLNKMLERSNGMFAFALWDSKERNLRLVRDRIGIKPLYYGRNRDGFYFASELRAFQKIDGFGISEESIETYLFRSFLPAPASILKDVRKLPTGSILTIGDGGDEPTVESYWSFLELASSKSIKASEDEAVHGFEQLLARSINLRMISDVPIGTWLSGGLDSSTVTALMQAQSSSQVKTFSIGFKDKLFDEAPFAKKIAKHLGTDHTEHYLSESELLDEVPQLMKHSDEPFGDASFLPTLVLSRLTKQQVTVALTGDGGDELFGGYSRYRQAARAWRLRKVLRWPLRIFSDLWPGKPLSKYKLKKLTEAIQAESFSEFYWRLVSHEQPVGSPSDLRLGRRSLFEQMMLMDSLEYLPDDLLTKVDRASMTVSLEARVPLLDHNVVEYLWSLPVELKVNKKLLRRVLSKHVPAALFQRRKQGFSVPIANWLRGPLRAWAEELLAETALDTCAYLDTKAIRRKWAEHLSFKADWHYDLWDILMLQSWRENG